MTPLNDNTAMGVAQSSADGASDEALGGRWRLDPRRSRVEFRVGNFWGLQTVRGHFEAYHGRLDLSATPAIELTIDAATVQTGNRKRDQHLRAADFFDVENHPQVQFVSDSVTLRGDTLAVRGRLSARGRSIAVELDAELRRIDGELEIRAATTVLQAELGITFSPLGTVRPHSKLLVNARLIQETG